MVSAGGGCPGVFDQHGPTVRPLYWLAGFISSKLNYHQSFFSYIYLPGNSLDFGTYTVLAIMLRKMFKLDWRLRSIRDVMVLLFVALPLSGVAAFVATSMLILDHVVPWSGYASAALDWWIGDAVAIACFTPFCLVIVMPVVRRFAGLGQTAADIESAAASKNIHEAHGSQRAAESLCFVAAIVGAVWLGLGIKTAGNHDTFYVFFFPVIWIAVRRGLRGAATGILLLDIGIVLSLEFSGGDSARFLVL